MMAHGVLDRVHIFKADGPPLPSVTAHNDDGLINRECVVGIIHKSCNPKILSPPRHISIYDV
jgi:hypothetical protein